MTYLIALGSNEKWQRSDPASTLRRALDLLAEGPDIRIAAVSRWYDSPAWPAGSGPDFVNAAAVLHAELAPADIVQKLHAVETALGRRRAARWEPRTCDLDLIGAGATILPDRRTVRRWMEMPAEQARDEVPDRLILPHPRAHERAFVLLPLQDVAPGWIHPVLGKSVAELVADLPEAARRGVRPRGGAISPR